jgi:hypothetical protein
MANVLDSGSLDTLTKGESLLLSAHKTKSNKVQLQFAEKKSANSNSILARLNKSDDRFSSKATRCWLTVEVADVKELMGLDVSLSSDSWVINPETKKEIMELNVLNPVMDDKVLRIIVIESTNGSDYERANLKTRAKRAGREGEYIMHKNQHIFMHKDIVDDFEDGDDVILVPDNNESGIQANSGVSESEVTVEETPFAG